MKILPQASIVLALAGLFHWPLLAGEPSRGDALPNILFCIADDWSWPHAGTYGDSVVKTPNFDRVAREGALFTRAFCAAPSCTPSRAAILTGQAPHRLREGANLWGFLPDRFPVYPDLLEKAGYVVGLKGKGWGPGNAQAGGWKRNPAGPSFKSFEDFLNTAPKGKPFCFWFGSSDPHRPYDRNAGRSAGLKVEDVVVPPYLPDTPEVRNDLLDYFFEIQRFDRDVGALLDLLEQRGDLDNTLVVVTSDNGMPFPRCKANVYDSGARMPLAMRWPARIRPGRVVDDFVSLADLAPTFLEAAGLKSLRRMTGLSLVPLLEGRKQSSRDKVFIERERHANVRKGDLGFPSRAIRTTDFLYVRNLRPDRWPAGDPEMWKAVGEFGDCDNGPSKDLILSSRDRHSAVFSRAFEKRPEAELYDLRRDPHQIANVADDPTYASARKRLRRELDRWMKQSEDPRATGGGDEFDRYPYFGGGNRMPAVAPGR
ncbi:MAG TPA: sulfatase [Verrucomicrobiae bacterium]|nr:sulfatase [Verrucomicrobiae bacterium]